MPRIAQIKRIDGEIWVRVDMTDPSISSITLWTADEIQWHDRNVALACLEAMQDWMDRNYPKKDN